MSSGAAGTATTCGAGSSSRTRRAPPSAVGAPDTATPQPKKAKKHQGMLLIRRKSMPPESNQLLTAFALKLLKDPLTGKYETGMKQYDLALRVQYIPDEGAASATLVLPVHIKTETKRKQKQAADGSAPHESLYQRVYLSAWPLGVTPAGQDGYRYTMEPADPSSEEEGAQLPKLIIMGNPSATNGNATTHAAGGTTSDAGSETASGASGTAHDTTLAADETSAPSSGDKGLQQLRTPIQPSTSQEDGAGKKQQVPQAPKPPISVEAATGKEHQGPSELGLEGGTSKEVGGQPTGSWLKKTVEAIPASPEAKLALGQLISQVLRNPQGARVWRCTNIFRLEHAKDMPEYMETILEVLRKVLDRLEHSQPDPLGQDIMAPVLKLLNSRTLDEMAGVGHL